MSHAIYSPSSAYRWLACPGSVRACAGIESVDNVYSREGTFAHTVAADCLRESVDAAKHIGRTDGEFTVDKEMADHLQVYVDAVRSVHALEGGDLLIEQPVEVNADVYGTADAIVFGDDEMHVFDLKFGRGVYVEAAGNPQLRTYGVAAVKKAARVRKNTALHIVQPRAFADRHWRSERFRTEDLMRFEQTLLAGVERAKAPDAPLVPGDHCGFCPARASCPALRERALTNAQSVFKNLELSSAPLKPPSVVNLTPEQISVALHGAEIVKVWLKSVEEMAYAMLERGETVPGWKLVEKRGNRKWTDEAAAAEALTLARIDPYAPREVLSPAQAEKALAKVLGRAKGEALVEKLAHKPVTGNTLVPESDSRPALVRGTPFVPLTEK